MLATSDRGDGQSNVWTRRADPRASDRGDVGLVCAPRGQTPGALAGTCSVGHWMAGTVLSVPV